MDIIDAMADVLHRDILAHPKKYSPELVSDTKYYRHVCEKNLDGTYAWPFSRANWIKNLGELLPGNCTEND